jgi:hypothetical protein
VIHPSDVRAIAQRAIDDRLGYVALYAILSVAYETGDPFRAVMGDRLRAVILHVNSGGNAAACRIALGQAGYLTEPTGYDPFAEGNYGVQMRVRRAP